MTKKPTQVSLGPSREMALQAKARAQGTRIAEEIRRAVDTYLAGVSPDELNKLEAGSRKFAQHLAEMSKELEHVNARLDEAFAMLSRSKRRETIQ